MKSKKLRIISLLMAFIVLLSSIGFGIFEHTCNFTHKKTISVIQQDDCCTPTDDSSSETSLRKASCCSSTKTLAKVEVNQSSTEVVYKFTIAQFIQQTPVFIEIVKPVILITNNIFRANPPPVNHKLYLVLYQTFLI